jgi:hypothetical protein
MNIFQKVFTTLNKYKIKYIVVGGVAVNLHGYSRFTGDLDILLLLEEENLKKMDKAMKVLGYSERLPVSILELKDKNLVKKWLKEKNLKAYSFFPPKNTLLQIDVITEESLKFKEFSKNKIIKKISSTTIPIIHINDLLKMKKRANRKIDIIDLEALIKIKNS